MPFSSILQLFKSKSTNSSKDEDERDQNQTSKGSKFSKKVNKDISDISLQNFNSNVSLPSIRSTFIYKHLYEHLDKIKQYQAFSSCIQSVIIEQNLLFKQSPKPSERHNYIQRIILDHFGTIRFNIKQTLQKNPSITSLKQTFFHWITQQIGERPELQQSPSHQKQCINIESNSKTNFRQKQIKELDRYKTLKWMIDDYILDALKRCPNYQQQKSVIKSNIQVQQIENNEHFKDAKYDHYRENMINTQIAITDINYKNFHQSHFYQAMGQSISMFLHFIYHALYVLFEPIFKYLEINEERFYQSKKRIMKRIYKQNQYEQSSVVFSQIIPRFKDQVTLLILECLLSNKFFRNFENEMNLNQKYKERVDRKLQQKIYSSMYIEEFLIKQNKNIIDKDVESQSQHQNNPDSQDLEKRFSKIHITSSKYPDDQLCLIHKFRKIDDLQAFCHQKNKQNQQSELKEPMDPVFQKNLYQLLKQTNHKLVYEKWQNIFKYNSNIRFSQSYELHIKDQIMPFRYMVHSFTKFIDHLFKQLSNFCHNKFNRIYKTQQSKRYLVEILKNLKYFQYLKSKDEDLINNKYIKYRNASYLPKFGEKKRMKLKIFFFFVNILEQVRYNLRTAELVKFQSHNSSLNKQNSTNDFAILSVDELLKRFPISINFPEYEDLVKFKEKDQLIVFGYNRFQIQSFSLQFGSPVNPSQKFGFWKFPAFQDIQPQQHKLIADVLNELSLGKKYHISLQCLQKDSQALKIEREFKDQFQVSKHFESISEFSKKIKPKNHSENTQPPVKVEFLGKNRRSENQISKIEKEKLIRSRASIMMGKGSMILQQMNPNLKMSEMELRKKEQKDSQYLNKFAQYFINLSEKDKPNRMSKKQQNKQQKK